MNEIEQQYIEAWERLKIGKPKLVDKNMPINELNTVALEAGKKKGSLRKSKFPDLCKKIQEFEIDESPLQKCIREKNTYKEIAAEKDYSGCNIMMSAFYSFFVICSHIGTSVIQIAVNRIFQNF